MLIGIDTESYYSKDVSITVQGHYHYLRHPECDIYMISAVWEDGRQYVGRLENAPWTELQGHTWIHHNAAHEEEVWAAAVEKGQMPEPQPEVIHCTADMAAYLGSPRSLAGACEDLLKVTVEKDVRDKMKGRIFERQTPEFQAEVREYALTDARRTLELFQKHGHKWPEWERALSRLTRRMAQRGVQVDVELVERYCGDLKRMIWDADVKIPWSGSAPALSYKKLCEECRKVGIRPPASLAMDDEDCAKWEELHGDTYPWVAAMRQKRRANTLLKKFQTLHRLVRPDGRASLPLKYCGAGKTRRWSGSAGFNAQNMSRDELLGTEQRRCIIARPGHDIVAPDYAQIEPRVLAVLAGDKKTLELLTRMDIYEAHARATMGYDLPQSLKSMAVEPKYEVMRRLAKARCVSGDTLVLTTRGYIPITEVLLTDMVWDGIQWCSHDGVIHQGYRKTVPFFGDNITDDHEVFISETETTKPSTHVGGQAPQVERDRLRVPGWHEVGRVGVALFRTCASVGFSTVKVSLLLWQRGLSRFRKFTARTYNSVRSLWNSQVARDTGLSSLGPSP